MSLLHHAAKGIVRAVAVGACKRCAFATDALAIAGRPGVVRVGSGRGGRSSAANLTVTVFGCTGLVGRVLVTILARTGMRLVLPWRGDEQRTMILRPCGDLGQLSFHKFDYYDAASLRSCVKHSDVVFNLVGRDGPRFTHTLQQSNVDSALNIAHVCALEHVPHIVHMSHLSAPPSNSSKTTNGATYLESKGAGELALRQLLPNATIVKSASVYGFEDRLLTLYANLDCMGPRFPVFGSGLAEKRPLSVDDVARGLANIAVDPTAPGSTYEFFSPKSYTVDETVDIYLAAMVSEKKKIHLRGAAGRMLARRLAPLYPNTIFADTVDRFEANETPSGRADVRTLDDAGVANPLTMEQAVYKYVRHFRHGRVYSNAMPEPKESQRQTSD